MKAKSATELALRKKQDARYEVMYKPGAPLLQMFQRHAAELSTLPAPPDVGPGGEVVQAHPLPEFAKAEVVVNEAKRLSIRETLTEGATRIAEDASIRRTDLLMRSSFDAVALGIDAAESISANNSIEKMLAHQMAVAHEASMRLLDRALSYDAGGRAMREGDSVEACRLANSAARLMSAFNDGAMTLQKLRTGGNQTVTVQHVNVSSGAQAVIGNVSTGGRSAGGNNGKDG
jgi:hypothetical protein